MERDDKRVPLGAAVSWFNASRRSERGHVVGAATRYATVLREDGARLRIRWGRSSPMIGRRYARL